MLCHGFHEDAALVWGGLQLQVLGPVEEIHPDLPLMLTASPSRL